MAIRHVAFEDLGLLSAILEDAGWIASVREAALDDLADDATEHADLLIVLGGPIGVYETDDYPFLSREIALVERRLARGEPTLGICLGCQLMARALGSRVFAGHGKEIGWGSIELTPDGERSCLGALDPAQASVLHWHGDTFDLPRGAVRLASSASYENQAFAYGQNALALQFHLEADPGRLEQWYVGHAVELAAAGISIRELRSETARRADLVRTQAERVFVRWLAQVG